MANPSKRTGTDYEVRLLTKLQVIWPALSRSSANTPSNDFHGAPFPIEAKKRAVLSVPEWVRKIRRVSTGNRWAIFVEDRDLRRATSFGEVMVVDAEFGRKLLLAFVERSTADQWLDEKVFV